MESQNNEENDAPKASDSPQQGEPASERRGPETASKPIRTDDPLITSEAGPGSRSMAHPSGTTVIETSRIRGPNEGYSPNFVIVPVESPQPRQERSSDDGGDDKEQDRQKGKGRKNQAGKNSSSKKGKDDDGDDDNGGESGGHREAKHGQSGQAPSLTRILLYSGIVALVCGIAGAWGYSYFFGSKSGDKSSSGNDSGSSKSSTSSKGSDSGSSSGSSGDSGSSNDSGTSKNSDTSKGSSSNTNSESGNGSKSSSKDSDANKLLEAEKAWMAAVRELHEAKEAEKAARQAEEEKKAVLEFLKSTLLSAGRPGDASLSDAFWAGGQGKDVTLHKALDVAASKASEEFEDRPLAEATVREILGLGYLNLGDPAAAVKQFERALALREAEQGVSHPETAACRNQLAIAYRLARLPAEAAHLYERNPNSPAHADALAVQGTTMLLEKKPAEAELKLRASLTVRQKIQPDDWKTFETKSLLGEALLDQGKYGEAEPLLVSAYEGMKEREGTIPPQERPSLIKALKRVVKLYEKWGKEDEAVKWRKKLVSLEITKRP